MQRGRRMRTHPGEVRLEEFLVPMAQTQVALAGSLAVPVQRINELVRGKCGVTPEAAWLRVGSPGARSAPVGSGARDAGRARLVPVQAAPFLAGLRRGAR